MKSRNAWLGFAIFLMFFGVFFALDFLNPIFLLASVVFLSVSVYVFYLVGKLSVYSNAEIRRKEEERKIITT